LQARSENRKKTKTSVIDHAEHIRKGQSIIEKDFDTGTVPQQGNHISKRENRKDL